MTTSDRPEPTARGQLSKTPFAHVLLYMRERALTGTLSIDVPPGAGELAGESLLTFEDGCLTQVRLATVIDPLGFVLRESNAITDAQLNESLARLARHEGLQGEILVHLGACDEDAVLRALRSQVRRKALHLFTVGGDVPYAYFDQCDLLAGWGGARVREDVLSILWRGVRANPDARAMEAVLARANGQAIRLRAGVDLRVFEFDRSAQGVIDTLRYDAAPLANLLTAGHDAHLARALIYMLLIAKQAEIVPLGTRTERLTPRQPAATAPASVSDSTSSQRSSRPSLLPRTSLRPSSPENLPVEMRARYDEAKARLAAMDEENFYQILGVASSASADAVRAAYLEQAARWHPDRAPNAALRQLHEQIFALITEAQETLTDETLAGRYLRSVQDGGGTPAAQRRIGALIEAATDAQKAEVCLRRREYDEAERLARKSLAVADDDPNTLSILAAVLMERRPEAAPSDEVVGLLARAVEAAPKHDRARVQYGTVLKRRGDAKGALENFQAALAANPKNMDAAREVRLAEMRAGRGSSPTSLANETTSDTRQKLGQSFIGRFLKK